MEVISGILQAALKFINEVSPIIFSNETMQMSTNVRFSDSTTLKSEFWIFSTALLETLISKNTARV